jgi:transposase
MIGPSGNVRVYLACGVTDMRRGIDGLSALVETVVKEAPGSGAIFGFRGKRADRIKLLWWDGQGFCLFYKILERGYFPWPTAKEGVAHLTQAQLSMLVEGIDWRARHGRPLLAEQDKSYILQGHPRLNAGASEANRLDLRIWKQRRWTVRTNSLLCAHWSPNRRRSLRARKPRSSSETPSIGLLRAQLELLRHRQHGASSEKIDRKIEQFELMLEEIEASRAEAELRSGKTPLPDLDDAPDKPKRKPLPDGLATEELIYAAPCNCPTCGGTSFLKAPDRVVQVLEHVPASVKIVRHVEKRMICKECDTTVAGEMPTLPIERGKPGPGLLAHIMVSKFDDHIPLYRLSQRCMIGWE